MKGTEIQRIGVLGCGLMGSGIAEVCARNGRDVVVVEANPMLVELGRGRVEKSLDAALNRGKLTEAEHAAALRGSTSATDWSTFADRQLVVEAISEDEALKIDVFRRLDSVVGDPEAILASNTSSIPIMKLATATKRPEQVVGMHFFNPVPVLPLVELVPVADDAPRHRRHGCRASPPRCCTSTSSARQDRAGFVVNALLIPYLLSAIRMLESGFATAHDIDAGMVDGCAHPMGPLALADLIGLDTTHGGRRVDVRRVQGAAVRAAAAAVPDGRGRAARAQVRARLLRVPAVSAPAELHVPQHPVRFVTAASLFDGHDAAINIMRRILQAQGAEVIHLGHNRSVDEVVRAALQEDVQGIAVSSYQGGHVEYFRYLVDRLREEGAGHVRVYGGGGGVIVPEEIAELHERTASPGSSRPRTASGWAWPG